MKMVKIGMYFGFIYLFLQTLVVYSADYLSPLTMVVDKEGKTLFIAEYTANQVAFFDLSNNQVKENVTIPAPPSGLIQSPDGKFLYVSGASPEGKVYVLDLSKKTVTGSISVGHTPNTPLISSNGKILYVCNQFNNDVAVIDLVSKKEIKRIQVLRQPVAAALTPDDQWLFVVNLLPAGPADSSYVGGGISVIDLKKNQVIKHIQLPNGSTGLRGIDISPDGKHAYVTHTLARYQLPTTQLERGWMNTNALSVIDVTNKKLINTVLLDDIDLGGANPWGVMCSADGKNICVTHAGTDELTVIDRQALHDKLTKVASGHDFSKTLNTLAYPDDVPNDLGFMVGLRKRLKLTGNGARDLTIVGSKVYIAEYFSESIALIDLNQGDRAKATSFALGPKQELTQQRTGEMFFKDASLCFQHWQSCMSCHPGNARTDALNWDLLNDGMGNPKNNKSLLFAHKTPPVMISGKRDRAEMAVRAGINFIQFAVRPEEDAQAIDEYLKSLKPVPSPHLINGKLSKAAERGKKVFEKAECITCHSRPLYTDLNQYDVGTGKGSEKNKEFDTPTLIEIWRTSPYLYDGRAAKMQEILTKFNIEDKHGKTSKLSPQELNDLVEFILSL
jgi:YVTN family beta-propeller protein